MRIWQCRFSWSCLGTRCTNSTPGRDGGQLRWTISHKPRFPAEPRVAPDGECNRIAGAARPELPAERQCLLAARLLEWRPVPTGSVAFGLAGATCELSAGRKASVGEDWPDR